MKKTFEIQNILFAVFFTGSLVLLCLTIKLHLHNVHGLNRRVNCNTFETREEMMQAYRGGATWLDSDGDGIPCESRWPIPIQYGG